MKGFRWNIPRREITSALKVAGLWPSGDRYKFNAYAIYFFLVVAPLVYTHNFFQFAKMFFIDDVSVAGAIIYVVLSDVMSILKLNALVQNMTEMKNITRDVDDEMFAPKNTKQEKLIEGNLILLKRAINLFSGVGVVAFIFWSAFPILDGRYKSFKLPFTAWYPYDFEQSPLYELTYLHQVLGIGYIIIINISVDLAIMSFMTFVGAQCDLLCDDLRNLEPESDIIESFIKCVLRHKKISRYARDFNKIIDNMLLIQFFTSTVSLGFTLFQLTMLQPFSIEFYSVLIYGQGVLVQILMYCWFGNEVQVKSSAIHAAAYQCNWIDAPLKFKKYLIFFMIRAMTPITFSAKNLFYLSMLTFHKIVRSGWSYFAVLQHIRDS